jgi:hypothetical protein
MEPHKPKSLQQLEERMASLDESSLRYQILHSAKSFKSSWVDLGRSLYTVYKDKLYKEWGYGSFDIYTVQEIGIRKQTALKLLRSYFFLEKEEPQYLKEEYLQQASATEVPSFESVDVLRQAKTKKVLDEKDYSDLKKQVFEKGRDAVQVKKDLTALIRQRQELEPEEVWEKKKAATVKRLMGVLKSLKQEAEGDKLLPAALLKDIHSVISKLEAELT